MPRPKFIKLVDGVGITEKQRLRLIKNYINKEISVTVEEDENGNIICTPMRYKQVVYNRDGEKVE